MCKASFFSEMKSPVSGDVFENLLPTKQIFEGIKCLEILARLLSSGMKSD